MFEYADRSPGSNFGLPYRASSRSTIARGSGPGSPAGWIQRSGAGFAIPELWLSSWRTVIR